MNDRLTASDASATSAASAAFTIGDDESLAALRAAAPHCPFLVDPADTAPYLTDWRGMFHGFALAVARPSNTAEVSAVMRACAALGIAVVPQGGNTGLAGGATPTGSRRQVVLSLGRMNVIRCIDRVSMTMVVEAGCVLQTAKDAAQEAGRFLPIAFAAQGTATVGGMIATNAGGINALRYGTVRQLVLGVEAVLADGSVVDGLRDLRKDNAGYDWKQWLIGSEGTLGIVTGAVLRLVPLPNERATAFVAVDSTAAAVALLERMQDGVGDELSAFELMAGHSIDIVVQHVGGRVPISKAPWYVLVELSGSAGGLTDRLASVLEGAMEAGDVVDAAVADSLTRSAQFWALRENITEAERHSGASMKHDVAVGVSDVPAFIDAASTALAGLSNALAINAFGHLGDGNIHFNVLLGASGVSGAEINRVVHDVVATFRGSISAEHGIGQYRVDELVRLKSASELALMRRIKLALDPDGLLNPQKVIGR